VLEITMHVISN